ncbi:MAG: hypothetical protein IKQ61_05645 [Spirochaetales bacterium]|nr:hypothetical protein [Spirochaetales bacterium]
MNTRVTKNIICVVVFVLVCAAAVLNIFISRPKTNSSYAVLREIKTIYFSEDDFPPEKMLAFKDFINNKDVTAFTDALNLPNPIYKFYGLCGLMRLHQKNVPSQLSNLLSNESAVVTEQNGTRTDTTLAKATLTLITTLPKWLVGDQSSTFYTDITSSLTDAFGSQYAKNDTDFRNALSSLISAKNPALMKDIYAKLNIEEPYSSKSFDEKLAIIRELDSYDAMKRKNALQNLLAEKHGTLLNGSIAAINENDSPELAEQLDAVMFGKVGESVMLNALNKYVLLSGSKCIDEVQRFMKERAGQNQNLLLSSIAALSEYGTMEDSYDFLKIYLANSYGDAVNEAAIKAIVKTSYDTDPVGVRNTMQFVVNKSNVSAAQYVIQWSIDERNHGYFIKPILDRFRRYENTDMKKLALTFIEFYKCKSGKDIVETLAADSNAEIKETAAKLLTDKSVFPQ